MKKLTTVLSIAAVVALVGIVGQAFADLNYTQGSGTIIFDFICATTKHCVAHVPIDSTGAEKATAANPWVVDTSNTGNLITAVKNPPGLGTAGGWTPLHIHNLLAVATTVKAGPGQLGLVQCDNVNGSTSYVQIFNALTGSITLGTTPPTQTVPIAANSTNGFTLNLVGMQYSTAISVAVTTTDNGNTAPGSGLNCNFGYN